MTIARAIPANLPNKLAITLWDFSWYVRSGPGEPFENLDRAFAEAGERGYNTIRICAMPFLLFGSGIDTTSLTLGPLGGGYAQRVRWYDVKVETTINGRSRLLELFRSAKEHGFFVILSSWEYQQSSSFATDRAWYDALMAIDPEQRAERLVDSLADMVDFLAEHDLDDRIAFTEVHNEVQSGHLTDGLTTRTAGDPDQLVLALKPRLERAVDRFHERHHDLLCAVNYGGVPIGVMRGIPDNVDVLVTHPYVYGVLDEFEATFGLRGPIDAFPQEHAAQTFLLAAAPPIAEWTVRDADRWKLDATIISKGEVYAHDWGDAQAIDRWLYDHYGEHRLEMETRLRAWISVAADWATARSIPVVFGEGWVGYTPLESTFEGGPVGAEFCRLAAREAARVNAWGSIVCSNAAPHHPMWDDIDLQQECNALFTAPHTT